MWCNIENRAESHSLFIHAFPNACSLNIWMAKPCCKQTNHKSVQEMWTHKFKINIKSRRDTLWLHMPHTVFHHDRWFLCNVDIWLEHWDSSQTKHVSYSPGSWWARWCVCHFNTHTPPKTNRQQKKTHTHKLTSRVARRDAISFERSWLRFFFFFLNKHPVGAPSVIIGAARCGNEEHSWLRFFFYLKEKKNPVGSQLFF